MRSGSWAKRRARAKRLRFIRRNLLVLAALVALFSVAGLFLWVTTAGPWRACALGMTAVGCAWMIYTPAEVAAGGSFVSEARRKGRELW